VDEKVAEKEVEEGELREVFSGLFIFPSFAFWNLCGRSFLRPPHPPLRRDPDLLFTRLLRLSLLLPFEGRSTLPPARVPVQTAGVAALVGCLSAEVLVLEEELEVFEREEREERLAHIAGGD